jgi:hypothetical protein
MPAMRTSTIVALALSLSLTACATTSTRPVHSEFEDIPVPKGLTYRQDDSTIIESPTVKAARLLYRGRIEPASLGVSMRSTLDANGWRNVSNTLTGSDGAVQIYEKGGNTLQVRIWESWWYTYVELTASRALTGTQSGQAGQIAPATASPLGQPGQASTR